VNQINPRKLLNSKWTAVNPDNREKHFMVTDVEYDEEGAVLSCALEAVISRRVQAIEWAQLKNTSRWQYGWK